MDPKKLASNRLTLRNLSLGMLSYTSTSILGPLVFFLLIGYLLDRLLDTKPLFIFIGVIIAFFFTNIFLYKKIKILIKEFEKEKKDQDTADSKENNKENNLDLNDEDEDGERDEDKLTNLFKP